MYNEKRLYYNCLKLWNIYSQKKLLHGGTKNDIILLTVVNNIYRTIQFSLILERLFASLLPLQNRSPWLLTSKKSTEKKHGHIAPVLGHFWETHHQDVVIFRWSVKTTASKKLLVTNKNFFIDYLGEFRQYIPTLYFNLLAFFVANRDWSWVACFLFSLYNVITFSSGQTGRTNRLDELGQYSPLVINSKTTKTAYSSPTDLYLVSSFQLHKKQLC